MKGLIVKGIAGFYYVKTDDAIFECKARGIFKKDGIIPKIGDVVTIEVLQDGNAVINAIDERKNEFIRPPISNVDCFVVVIAAAKPEPNLRVVDRFLVMAEKNKAEAMICVNKTDLADEEKIQTIQEIYENIYPVVFVSAFSGDGIDALRASMGKKEKYALAGPSGAGKSTLLNALLPSAEAETGEISKKTSRGKHTTRHAEIFEIESGAMVYDTPGFTSFDVIDVEADELQHLYPEIEKLYGQCKYRNCMHIKEAGCAVIDAVKAGTIHQSRYDSYKEMVEEVINNREF
ncbi:MAG: ribosome small subunit-dependent GTPase A [Clostridiales bacterium]|nr:ribosome small subunit-dependent GTPase A [Clostridiales bacterium]